MSGRDPFDTSALQALGLAPALRLGELAALAEGGTIAIVQDGAGATAAMLRASTIVDLHAGHIGCQVLFTVIPGSVPQAVVMGVLRGGRDADTRPTVLHVDVDGQRCLVQAERQMVLRCGKASITLTQAGKVLIEGTHVLSRATGANRLQGGSVQLN
ncbi:DUF6484 domain-containing protein [Roseateles chitinivorans]|uniref:DUF6484 domain-containing protein n=1 Tax=Roseateles chitinivorans TaxID=2917965 RepID=UPI003D66A1FD